MTEPRAYDPLPPPHGTPYRIATVCLGNICRSPIAAVVLEHRLADAGLDDQVEVTSSGTGGWHTGEPMDRRAAGVLLDHGFDPSRHRARLFEAYWFDRDLILTMDAQNFADVTALGGRPGQVRMFREFDPEVRDQQSPPDLPDPWYGGPADFELTLAVADRTAGVLVDLLADLLAPIRDRPTA